MKIYYFTSFVNSISLQYNMKTNTLAKINSINQRNVYIPVCDDAYHNLDDNVLIDRKTDTVMARAINTVNTTSDDIKLNNHNPTTTNTVNTTSNDIKLNNHNPTIIQTVNANSDDNDDIKLGGVPSQPQNTISYNIRLNIDPAVSSENTNTVGNPKNQVSQILVVLWSIAYILLYYHTNIQSQDIDKILQILLKWYMLINLLNIVAYIVISINKMILFGIRLSNIFKLYILLSILSNIFLAYIFNDKEPDDMYIFIILIINIFLCICMLM